MQNDPKYDKKRIQQIVYLRRFQDLLRELYEHATPRLRAVQGRWKAYEYNRTKPLKHAKKVIGSMTNRRRECKLLPKAQDSFGLLHLND